MGLGRALMLFGAPSRQLVDAACLLEVDAEFIHLLTSSPCRVYLRGAIAPVVLRWELENGASSGGFDKISAERASMFCSIPNLYTPFGPAAQTLSACRH
jgi:hypothetical protein